MRTPARDQSGSGTAIGVAIMFPFLILVIVVLQILADSARAEQALQNAANRAARTASLCCHYTGGRNGAEEVVRASLASAEAAGFSNRILCSNSLVADSGIVFIGADGYDVPINGNSPVPPGGTVYVFLTCRLPARAMGGFGVPGLEAERNVMGVAAIDPFRTRSGG